MSSTRPSPLPAFAAGALLGLAAGLAAVVLTGDPPPVLDPRPAGEGASSAAAAGVRSDAGAGPEDRRPAGRRGAGRTTGRPTTRKGLRDGRGRNVVGGPPPPPEGPDETGAEPEPEPPPGEVLANWALDDLVAALWFTPGEERPSGIDPNAVVAEIRSRFPRYRFPRDLLLLLLSDWEGSNWHSAGRAASETWSPEDLIGEFQRSLSAADARPFWAVGDTLAWRLEVVEEAAPRSLVRALLGRREPAARLAGISLAWTTDPPEFGAVRRAFDDAPDAAFREMAIWTVVDRYHYDDEDAEQVPVEVSDLIRAALEDRDAIVRRAAVSVLDAVGPAALPEVLGILRKGGVDTESRYSLVHYAHRHGALADLIAAGLSRESLEVVVGEVQGLAEEFDGHFAAERDRYRELMRRPDFPWDFDGIVEAAGMLEDHEFLRGVVFDTRVAQQGRLAALEALLCEEDSIGLGLSAARAVVRRANEKADLRMAVLECMLGWVEYDDPVTREFLTQLGASEENFWIREAAREALADWEE